MNSEKQMITCKQDYTVEILSAFLSVYRQVTLLQADCGFTYRDMEAYESLKPLVQSFLDTRDRLIAGDPRREDILHQLLHAPKGDSTRIPE